MPPLLGIFRTDTTRTDIKVDNILIDGEPIPVRKEPVHIKVKVLTANFKLIDFDAGV